MTSSSFDKDLLFYQAIQNILIAYYIRVAYSKKKLYTIQKNQMLKPILKSYLNKSKYKPIKRELKGLVIWEKQSALSLENKLLEIYDLAEKYYVDSDSHSDLSKLYQSFTHIKKLCTLRIDVTENDENKDINTLYVTNDDIIQSFDKDGSWKGGAIRLLVPNNKREEVVRYFNKTHLRIKENENLKSPFHMGFFVCLE